MAASQLRHIIRQVAECAENISVGMPRKSLSLIGLRVVGQMHLASMRYERPAKRIRTERKWQRRQARMSRRWLTYRLAVPDTFITGISND